MALYRIIWRYMAICGQIETDLLYRHLHNSLPELPDGFPPRGGFLRQKLFQYPFTLRIMLKKIHKNNWFAHIYVQIPAHA